MTKHDVVLEGLHGMKPPASINPHGAPSEHCPHGCPSTHSMMHVLSNASHCNVQVWDAMLVQLQPHSPQQGATGSNGFSNETMSKHIIQIGVEA